MAADTPDVEDVAELSYEQARDELVDVVRRLEADPVIAVVSTLLVTSVVMGVLVAVVMRRRPA